MDNQPKRSNAGFSMLEVLVVTGIIVLLAGLIVGLAGVTGDKKKVTRAKAEIARIALLIDTYKSKKGVYPPDNRNNPGTNSLFYELAGATLNSAGNYETAFTNATVSPTALQNAFNVGGILNSDRTGNAEDTATVLRLLTEVRGDQTNIISVNGASVVVLSVPMDGPDGRKVNPLFYLAGTNAVHNPGQFDLWAEIKSGNNTKVIGNWKD